MIYKHPRLHLPFFMGLGGAYIILKYTVSPFLYLLRRLGFNSSLPSKIDATINRSILPLTENADKKGRMDVMAEIQEGDLLPSIPIIYPDGSFGNLDKYTNTPLLLVFVRGSWCSYSRLHLSDLVSKKEDFAKAGIKILAITSYRDQAWWLSKGIDIPMGIDSKGEVFNRFGIQNTSWMELVWGRVLPHESAFLFDDKGVLVSSDVRKVNGFVPGQRFLGSEKWLEIAHKNL